MESTDDMTPLECFEWLNKVYIEAGFAPLPGSPAFNRVAKVRAALTPATEVRAALTELLSVVEKSFEPSTAHLDNTGWVEGRALKIACNQARAAIAKTTGLHAPSASQAASACEPKRHKDLPAHQPHPTDDHTAPSVSRQRTEDHLAVHRLLSREARHRGLKFGGFALLDLACDVAVHWATSRHTTAPADSGNLNPQRGG